MSNKKLNYTLELDAEIGDIVAKFEKVKQSMEGLMKNGNTSAGLEKSFSSIERALDRIKEKASVPVTGESTFTSLKKDAASIEVQLEKLGSSVSKFHDLSNSQKIELLPPELASQIQQAESALETFANSFAAATQKSDEYLNAQKRLSDAEKELTKIRETNAQKEQNIAKRQADADSAQQNITNIEKQIAVLKRYQEAQKAYSDAGAPKNKALAGTDFNLPKQRAEVKKILPEGTEVSVQNVEKVLADLGAELEKNQQDFKEAEKTVKNWENQLTNSRTKASTMEEGVESLKTEIDKLNKEFEENKAQKTSAAFQQLTNKAKALGIDMKNIPTEYTEEAFEQLNNELQRLVTDGIAQADAGFDQVEANLNEVRTSTEAVTDAVDRQNDEWAEANTQFQNNTALMSRIQAFVGLEGGIEIARSAMRNAMDTIKELDAVMTEMAVVTDLEIGDYWDQLPEHTERANALGVAIKDVYEAETLYYQQGLKTNEVTEMSAETLKMARIAGLSAEDATNKMTAALRGFNMELNETSAQKVADVYSELAAITASDVDEIASAMTKTASIASSAGMEFETTAAFLSQIIETTRESAETAGTAMKTVIARFQELKKDPAEIGEVDGEIVDANKIETALRSVGVSLRDTNGQFRELDEVFLELAGKWDGLDTNTQRYIATIAAGSRQQSRFIAMMSDYGRTTELVNAANNSAGASNQQFEKTLSSIETALNNLKNAWDTFTMGIMDNELITFGIDLLTGLIEALNSLTELFEPLGLDGAAKIGLIIGALYLGDKALKTFMGSFGETKSIFASFGAVGNAAITGVSNAFSKLNKATKQASLQAAKLHQVMKRGFNKTQTAAIKDYNKALAQEQKINTAREKTRQKMLVLESQGKKNTAEYVKMQSLYNNTQSSAERLASKRVLSELGVYTALELNTQQQLEANAMTAKGISIETAASLASAGYTAAQIAEEAASENLTEQEYAEGLAKQANTSKTGLAAIASFILASAHTLQTQGLKALIVQWWADLKAKVSNTVATWAQVSANIALQTSMWYILLIVVIIVAAIIILVAIIWLLVEAFAAAEKNSPEGQLKSAEEAADAAAEAADRAAESYNNLADAFESLDDKYASLEEMTRGTKEWEKAVKEVNEEVLGLIDKYPELAAFVDGSEGYLKLEIESDEVQGVLKKYEMDAAKAQAASLAAKANVTEKRNKVTATNLQEDLDYAWITKTANGNAQGGGYNQQLSEDTMTKISQALTSGDIMDNEGDGDLQDELTEWIQNNGTDLEKANASSFATSLEDSIESLKEFGTELDAAAAQEKAYNQQMANAALGTVDSTKYTEDQLKQMQNVSTDAMAARYQEEIQSQFDDMSKEDQEAAKLEVAQSLYGPDAEIDGNTITYEDENGEEQTKELTDEEFKEQYAAMEATEKMTAAFELVPGIVNKVRTSLQKFGSEVGKAYQSIVTDSSKTTFGEAKSLNSQVGTEAFTIELRQQWLNLSEAEQEIYGNFEDFAQTITGPLGEINASFDNTKNTLERFGVSGEALNEKFNSEGAESYRQALEKLGLSLGGDSEAISKLNSQINTLSASMSAEEFNVFIREFANIDMSNLNEWKGLTDTLNELGMESITTSSAFKELIADASDAAGAIEKIDLKAFAEQFRSLQNVIGDISSGEQGRDFDADSYDKLVKAAPELTGKFMLQNDGSYRYLGNSMNDLINAINANTEIQRQNQLEIIEDKKGANKIIEMLSSQTLSSGIIADRKTVAGGTTEDKKQYIASLVGSLKASGISVNSLGIEGLTDKTTTEGIYGTSDADIDKIITAINDLPSTLELEGEEKALSREMSQSAILNYSRAQNATMITQATNESTSENIGQTLDDLIKRSQVLLSQGIEAGVSESAIAAYEAKIAEMDRILNDSSLEAEEKAAALRELGLEEATADFLEMSDAAEKVTKEIEKWKTEFGYLDQLNRKITQTQREKEKIERDYNRLLETETATTEQLLELTKKEADNLNKQLYLGIQKWAESADALTAMTDKNGANAAFAKYVTYDAETGSISVDYTGAEAEFGDSTEMGEQFDAFISELYELQSTAEEAQDEIADIEEQTRELAKRGEDDYSELWNSIRETMIQNAQTQIDKLSEVNESIQNAESKLVEQIQQQIEEQRQARENEKTEQEISDKEARLAYLMRDTSGANDLEIQSLQKEIADEKEGYQDTLVDQSLQQLQDANEQAAQQREQQIALAQAQLDAYAASNQSWIDAQNVLNTALSNDGALGTSLASLGINMGMLLGSNGAVATTLTSLLTQNDEQNAIDAQNTEREIKDQMANASVYASMNGEIAEGNDLATELKNSINALKDDVGEVSTSTNGNIDATRDAIVTNQLNKAEADGNLKTTADALTNLFSPESNEYKVLAGIATGENLTTSATDLITKITGQAGGGATSPLFTSYKSSIDTIQKAMTDKKTFEAKKAFNDLLLEDKFISQDTFDVLARDGGFEGMYSYEDYVYHYNKNQTANHKKNEEFQTTIANQSGQGSSGGSGGSGGSGEPAKKESGFYTSAAKQEAGYTGGSQDIDWEDVLNGETDEGTKTINGREYHIEVRGFEESERQDSEKRRMEIADQAKSLDIPPNTFFKYKDQLYVWNTLYDERVGETFNYAALIRPGEYDYDKLFGLLAMPVMYKTGGLADYTGPAWLDGTKSHPELVLNARDTENFIQLKDILAEIMAGSTVNNNSNKNTSGDNYFTIDINVESLSDDYDVEQLADKIRNMIYDDSMYRNVNTVNLIR